MEQLFNAGDRVCLDFKQVYKWLCSKKEFNDGELREALLTDWYWDLPLDIDTSELLKGIVTDVDNYPGDENYTVALDKCGSESIRIPFDCFIVAEDQGWMHPERKTPSTTIVNEINYSIT